ncbi:MAG: nucleoside diphosphate kinase regulator [Gammaproteobacteria bacterium]
MADVELRSVILGASERDALVALLKKVDSSEFEKLFDELDAATVVADSDMPDDIVRMNSLVTYLDESSNSTSVVKLVYPGESDSRVQVVSVLAPIGAALIGLREGESISWPMPNGHAKTLRVLKVGTS